jgi:hypothetical protein
MGSVWAIGDLQPAQQHRTESYGHCSRDERLRIAKKRTCMGQWSVQSVTYLVREAGAEEKAEQRRQDLNGGSRSLDAVPASTPPWQRRDRSDFVCEIAVARTCKLDRLWSDRVETADVKDSREVHSLCSKLLTKPVLIYALVFQVLR